LISIFLNTGINSSTLELECTAKMDSDSSSGDEFELCGLKPDDFDGVNDSSDNDTEESILSITTSISKSTVLPVTTGNTNIRQRVPSPTPAPATAPAPASASASKYTHAGGTHSPPLTTQKKGDQSAATAANIHANEIVHATYSLKPVQDRLHRQEDEDQNATNLGDSYSPLCFGMLTIDRDRYFGQGPVGSMREIPGADAHLASVLRNTEVAFKKECGTIVSLKVDMLAELMGVTYTPWLVFQRARYAQNLVETAMQLMLF
jgi:hypothetical protein